MTQSLSGEPGMTGTPRSSTGGRRPCIGTCGSSARLERVDGAQDLHQGPVLRRRRSHRRGRGAVRRADFERIAMMVTRISRTADPDVRAAGDRASDGPGQLCPQPTRPGRRPSAPPQHRSRMSRWFRYTMVMSSTPAQTSTNEPQAGDAATVAGTPGPHPCRSTPFDPGRSWAARGDDDVRKSATTIRRHGLPRPSHRQRRRRPDVRSITMILPTGPLRRRTRPRNSTPSGSTPASGRPTDADAEHASMSARRGRRRGAALAGVPAMFSFKDIDGNVFYLAEPGM